MAWSLLGLAVLSVSAFGAPSTNHNDAESQAERQIPARESASAASGNPSPTLDSSVSELTLQSTTVDFGEVTLKAPSTQVVTLTASSTAAITLQSLQVSGEGFTVSGLTLPARVNPGETVELYIEFAPSTKGAVEGQVTIASDAAKNGEAVIALHGTGRPPSVIISWDQPEAPADAPEDSPSQYLVFRGNANGTGFKLVGALPGTDTTYEDKSVTSGKRYTYYVVSKDESGLPSGPSDPVVVDIP